MSNTDALKRKIRELENLADELRKLGITILEEALPEEKETPNSGWLDDFDYRHPMKEIQRKAIRKYQGWYSTSLHLVTEYAPEWLNQFKSHYYESGSKLPSGVSTYFSLRGYFNYRTRAYVIGEFIKELDEQVSILLSIPSIVEIKEMKLRKLISADFVKTEVEEAEFLLTAKHYRAAGAVAGVALELYLKTLCDVHRISYPPKATLEPLAQALYKDAKLDTTELKHIQYLASIRNKCSHAEDVSETEVRKLIEEVRKLPS